MKKKISSVLVLSGFLLVNQVSASPVSVVSVAKRLGRRGQSVPIEMISGAVVNAYMPSLGRLRFKFDEVNPLSNKVSVESGVDCDQRSFSALRGMVKARRFSGRASAIGVHIDGEEYLRVSFVDPTSKRSKLHRITIPLKHLKDASATAATNGMGEGVCSVQSNESSLDTISSSSVEDASTQDGVAQAEATSIRVASLSTFADKAWSTRFGSLAGQQVAMFVQEAELVFKEQLAMRFRVENIVINVFDSVAKAGGSDASSILNVFSSYVRSSPYYKKSDLYHLLTGVDLSGSTIGIAYVGVLCKAPDHVHGVSSFTNNTVTPVTVAHELGHNFGANHSTAGIMKPAADGEGLSTLRFNSASVSEMKGHLGSVNYSCVPVSTKTSSPTPVPTTTPTVTPTPTPKPTPESPPTGVSVGLSVTKLGEGRFSYTVRTDKARSACRLAMQYSFDQKPWGTFLETAMSGSSISGSGRFTSSSTTPVRVSALYTCGTSISKRSNIEDVVPGRI